jgi:hypothetical protein
VSSPDERLASALTADDAAEDAGMHPDDRTTCHTHQSWFDDCKTDPIHTEPISHALRTG